MAPSHPDAPTPGDTFEDLLRVVKKLRDPGGCPWDREQTHSSLRQYLLEEAYETLEAIDSGDPVKLKEELGDVLGHIAFHADMARRAGEFTAEEMFRAEVAKLIRRHPHVFGGGEKLRTSGEVVEQWEAIKRREGGRNSVADGIPSAMPALAYAAALQRRGAKAGHTWHGERTFRPRMSDTQAEREAKAGAYLWAVVARLQEAGVDSETALRSVAVKFRDRVRRAEKRKVGKANRP